MLDHAAFAARSGGYFWVHYVHVSIRNPNVRMPCTFRMTRHSWLTHQSLRSYVCPHLSFVCVSPDRTQFRFPACCYLTSILYYNKLTSRFPGLKSIGSKVIPSGGVIDVVTLASSFGLSCWWAMRIIVHSILFYMCSFDVYSSLGTHVWGCDSFLSTSNFNIDSVRGLSLSLVFYRSAVKQDLNEIRWSLSLISGGAARLVYFVSFFIFAQGNVRAKDI